MAMEIWSGPSRIDGEPIVVLATGYDMKSSNIKTGAMIQTWILRADVEPHTAVKTGEDYSICGTCPHRGVNGKNRTCYVQPFHAPLSVYRQWKAGRSESRDLHKLAGKPLRIGSYGDTGAVPVEVWQELAGQASTFTGYTRAWEYGVAGSEYAPYAMASVVNREEVSAAIASGWRPFYVMPEGSTRPEGTVACPASAEQGKKTVCADCGMCAGTTAVQTRPIVIQVHGTGKKNLVSV